MQTRWTPPVCGRPLPGALNVLQPPVLRSLHWPTQVAATRNQPAWRSTTDPDSDDLEIFNSAPNKPRAGQPQHPDPADESDLTEAGARPGPARTPRRSGPATGRSSQDRGDTADPYRAQGRPSRNARPGPPTSRGASSARPNARRASTEWESFLSSPVADPPARSSRPTLANNILESPIQPRDQDNAPVRRRPGSTRDTAPSGAPRPGLDRQGQPGTRAPGTRALLFDTGDEDLEGGQSEGEDGKAAAAPGAAEGEQQAGEVFQPAKPPPVRMSLDLPVVRPSSADDKGTFFADVPGWRHLGLSPPLVTALNQLGIARPSHIQAASLRAWRVGESQHLALADQAGSGKTLAYLLPLFQVLKAEDAANGSPITTPNCPRAVVLAPTVELVQQVYRVAKALSGAGARLRTMAMTGGQDNEAQRYKSMRTQVETLARGVDLVIATPGRMAEHMRHGALSLSACKALVVDEVDVLLGEQTAFKDQITPLRAAAPPSMRFVLVTATLPQHTAAALQAELKDIQLVAGPGLHRTAAGLTEELIDCSGGDEVSLASGIARKIEAMHRTLRKHAAPRALVFCNKIESARDVENSLRRKYKPEEVQVLVYHEAIREDVRQATMNAFLTPPGQESAALAKLSAAIDFDPWAGKPQAPGAKPPANTAPPAAEAEPPSPSEGTVGSKDHGGRDGSARPSTTPGAPRLVLVATDRMSRGIDCIDCEHVVLFDFPRDPSEYVRRVGRTARGAGGRGVVSALVLGREVALAQDIIGRNQKGHPVHRLPQL